MNEPSPRSDSSGDSFGVALTSFNAANVYASLHRFAAARAHYQLAEELYREKGMTLAAAQAQYSLGYLYFLTGYYHQAIRTLHHVEPEFNRLGDVRGDKLLCGAGRFLPPKRGAGRPDSSVSC